MRTSLLSAIAATVATVAALPNGESCSPVHIIVARASAESPGYGMLESLSNLIKQNVPKATSEALKYPAQLDPYEPSFTAGVKEMAKRLQSYTAACKKSKIVLLGYSQGAHVIGDVLCGVGGANNALGPESKAPVGPDVTKQIAAIIQMGDPRFMAGLPFDRGTSKANGAFARAPDQMCPPDIAAKIRSYCDDGDVFCAGGDSIAVHMHYTSKYNKKALAWVLKNLNGS